MRCHYCVMTHYLMHAWHYCVITHYLMHALPLLCHDTLHHACAATTVSWQTTSCMRYHYCVMTCYPMHARALLCHHTLPHACTGTTVCVMTHYPMHALSLQCYDTLRHACVATLPLLCHDTLPHACPCTTVSWYTTSWMRCHTVSWLSTPCMRWHYCVMTHYPMHELALLSWHTTPCMRWHYCVMTHYPMHALALLCHDTLPHACAGTTVSWHTVPHACAGTTVSWHTTACAGTTVSWPTIPHAFADTTVSWHTVPHECAGTTVSWHTVPHACAGTTVSWHTVPHACAGTTASWHTVPHACACKCWHWSWKMNLSFNNRQGQWWATWLPRNPPPRTLPDIIAWWATLSFVMRQHAAIANLPLGLHDLHPSNKGQFRWRRLKTILEMLENCSYYGVESDWQASVAARVQSLILLGSAIPGLYTNITIICLPSECIHSNAVCFQSMLWTILLNIKFQWELSDISSLY